MSTIQHGPIYPPLNRSVPDPMEVMNSPRCDRIPPVEDTSERWPPNAVKKTRFPFEASAIKSPPVKSFWRHRLHSELTSSLALLFTLWLVLLPFRSFGRTETQPLQEQRYSVRYRAPEWLASRIQSLLTPSGHIKLEPARKLLIITDHPDTLKRIETTLQRLDLPIRDLEVVIQILQGRREVGTLRNESVELPDVIKKMRSFLKFEHYSLLERGFIRTVEFKPTVMILGDFRLRFTGEWAVEPRDVIRLVDLTLEHKSKNKHKKSPGYIRILTTTLNLRAGEPTVVGTARSESSPSILFLILQVRLVSPGGS